MQNPKDTKKPLLFKFVDEESEEYKNRSKVKERNHYEGGEDGPKPMKVFMCIAGLIVVALLVCYLALKGAAAVCEDGGDCSAGADSQPEVTPEAEPEVTPEAEPEVTPEPADVPAESG